MKNTSLHLHAEEVVLSLVRMRRKQLQMAAAVEAARNGSVEGEEGQDQAGTQDRAPAAQTAPAQAQPAGRANDAPWDPSLWEPAF